MFMQFENNCKILCVRQNQPCLPVEPRTSEIDVKNRSFLSSVAASLNDLVNRVQVF